MLDQFEASATGLLSVTYKGFQDRERGLYGILFAKPSKRLRATLGVDREILTVVSNFPDQQQRTIKVTRELVTESEGRLESTVAIIVHKDPHGNVKLKNWGREVGLSILPVYLAETIPTGEQFESLLATELFSHDPFDVTGPVSDDARFYGRRTEAQDLARKLQTGQIRSILGIRKIGKTSIINRVIADTRKHHDCISVMLDCSRDDVWQATPAMLIQGLADAVKAASETPGQYHAVEDIRHTESLSNATKELVAHIRSVAKPVIIFMDEVDYITPGSPTTDQWRANHNVLWRHLRAVYQEADRDGLRLSLLISGVSSKWFAVESVEGVENAALAFIPEEYLSPLPRGATIAMIKRIARTAGLQMEEDTAGMVAEVCSDMPYWVRKAGSYLHRKFDITKRPLAPSAEDVKAQLENFVRDEGGTIAHVAIRHLLSVYPELEAPVVQCSLGEGRGASVFLLSVLERYGIVDRRRGWDLSGEMIRAGLRMYLDGKTVFQAPSAAPSDRRSRELDLTEWADEIALLSKRRNMLEKRLRQIVLNFIRFATLSSKDGPKVVERVLATKQSRDRDRLKHLSAEEAIEKLTWLELAQLITKEWELFQRIFGDREWFIRHAEVVNERYDAHAKDADAADFALYRRSLRALEDAVAKVQ